MVAHDGGASALPFLEAWRTRYVKRTLIAAATLVAACGSVKDKQKDDPAPPAVAETATGSASSADALQDVRVCKVGPPAIRLQDAVTYSGDLYPIMQRACARCHGGAIENRQNSTNCFYLRDNADNVIRRLENALDAAARRAADPALTDDQLRSAYPEEEAPMPAIGGNREPLTEGEIELFRAWAEQDDQCQEGEPAPELAEIPTPEHYSSDEDEQAPEAFEELFGSANCEEGPEVNLPASWTLVESLLTREPNPPSAFYDYAAKAYVPGAEAVPFECNWDGLIASLSELADIEPTLREYEKHGWRLIQCAKLDGLPLAGMATLSRVTNTLGDVTYGVNYKTMTIENRASAEGGVP
jgi:hypothetical protein